MEDVKSIPFPQADDVEKILALANLENANRFNDSDYISINLGNITKRQVSYYTSACIYLGFLTISKELSHDGIEFRRLNPSDQEVELARRFIADRVVGVIFMKEKLYSIELSREEIAVQIQKYYPFYSEVLYNRRAQTVKSWLRWLHYRI